MKEWDALVLRTKIGLEMMEELHQVIVPGGEEAEIFGRELARRTTPEKLAERREREALVRKDHEETNRRALGIDEDGAMKRFVPSKKDNSEPQVWSVPEGVTVQWVSDNRVETCCITYEEAKKLSERMTEDKIVRERWENDPRGKVN